MSEPAEGVTPTDREPFRWPPGPDHASPRGPLPLQPDPLPSRRGDRITPLARALTSIASAWTDIERVWLDPRSTSFGTRAREAGWRADDASAYCPRCAHSVGPYEADGDGCSRCRGARLPWTRGVRLGVYDGLLRQAIHDLKFSAFRHVGVELGLELGQKIVHAQRRASLHERKLVIVPVPTSARRRLARRIDHTLTIARGVAKASGGTIVRALSRRHRPEQWAVAPSERSRNVAGAFRPRRRSPQSGSLVVLVDDVRTTGATLRSASRALQRSWRKCPKNERPVLWVAIVASAGPQERVQRPEAGLIVDAPGTRAEDPERRREVGAAVETGKEM